MEELYNGNYKTMLREFKELTKWNVYHIHVLEDQFKMSVFPKLIYRFYNPHENIKNLEEPKQL